MPTSELMNIPKMESPKEFEKICRDVLDKKFNSEFSLYGRNGQNQNGIDIVSNNIYVVQCKNYLQIKVGDILIKKIEQDIVLMKKLEFYKDIKKFIVMTAMDRDNKIQNNIISINNNNNYKFKIEILFWDDIQSEICEDKKLLKKYYPSLKTDIPIDKLVKKFNKNISSVVLFIQRDLTVPFEIKVINKVERFIEKIQRQLSVDISLQTEGKYKAIDEFVKLLDRFLTYLGQIIKVVDSFVVMNESVKGEEERIRKEWLRFIKNLNEFYMKINVGCFLF